MGIRLRKKSKIETIIISFFKNLFMEDERGKQEVHTDMNFPIYNVDQNRSLMKEVVNNKIRSAIFDIRGLKSLGKDGYLTMFYQKNWNIVRQSLCNFVKEAFGNRNIKDVNKTLICLIPKTEKPEFMNQYRPISLCNVTCKCVTKVIVNKLKPLFPNLISMLQTSFIPSRCIQENIVIA